MFLLTSMLFRVPMAHATGDTCNECSEPDGTLSGVGVALETGNTCGQGDDFIQACGGSDGEELAYAWTAPSTGTYRIDTDGSDYDTVLTIHEPCPSDDELACNDDEAGVGTPSAVEISLDSGQEVLMIIEGFSLECGPFQINISELADDTGTADTDRTPFVAGGTATSLAGEQGGARWSEDGCGCQAAATSDLWWGWGRVFRRR